MWPPYFLVFSVLALFSATCWTLVQPTFAFPYILWLGLSSAAFLFLGLYGELHYLRNASMPQERRYKSYMFLTFLTTAVCGGWIYFYLGFLIGSGAK